MNPVLPLLLVFLLLLFSVMQGYFVGYPLLVGLIILVVTFVQQGFSVKALAAMGLASSQKSFPVLSILLLIGAVTAVWMASGTVPALVYYGVQVVHPRCFVLSAFVLTSLVSLLLGTSFGTVSTIGVALMIMAKSGGANPHWVAGAIIAGAYLGDRCSPMSSSANLVASITQTRLYTNIKLMIKTAWLPLLISSLAYGLLSLSQPVPLSNSPLIIEIPNFFDLNPLVLLPALIIVVLVGFQVEVKRTFVVSIGISLALAIALQGYSLLQVLQFMLLGFRLQAAGDLATVMIGGGVFAMLKVCLVVLLSTAIAGIIAGTKALAALDQLLDQTSSRSGLFMGTTLVGLGSAIFGCSQTIAILMTQQLVQPRYGQEKGDRYQLAIDIENTAVVLSPLVPWNIAGVVPATILMTDAGFIPYALYLYLIPLLNFVWLKWTDGIVDQSTELDC